jgi:hypothetical protein
MGIEGLEFILKKQEVVPTVSADDLVNHPQAVESDYERHVRTYVPISRVAEGDEETLSVQDFEKRVITAVREKRAPRGYLTAEYGYGKTSTALYLWQRAERDGLVVVPPFQMLHLQDLITATYGWLRYKLSVRNPGLIPELEELHQATTARSLEQEAASRNISLVALRELEQEGRLILELAPTDYIHYFEKLTDIAERAGYAGVLVLPDEIQQYIEPRMRTSAEPLVPFFNLIQGIATREGRLAFGIIFIIGRKEVGLIRERRNDLLHRMRRLSIDLTNVYDRDFAKRLWGNMADEFNYTDISRDIVVEETLDALGEIASRSDLSDGPRTVINTFRRMVVRYRNYGSSVEAYSPIDLIDDLLGGAIQFSGNDQIQNVTRKALQNSIVKADTEKYEPAIKLAAAFPVNGVPLKLQQRYGIDEAIDELMRIAIGEIVIGVGRPEDRGVTLFGLHEGIQQTDWLTQAIREYRRGYGEQHTVSQERVISMFVTLLKTAVFKGWTVKEETESKFTQNRSIVFEGDFQSFASRFPSRRVHVRIMWEDEERKDATIKGDVAVEYRLSRYTHVEVEQRGIAYDPVLLEPDHFLATLPINLMYFQVEHLTDGLRSGLEGVWSPYDLSPMVLMNIYQLMEEKRADGLIPQSEDAYIERGFQPEIRRVVMRLLFNGDVGDNLGGVKDEYLTQKIVETLLNERYGDTYHTLMASGSWRNALQRYMNAVNQLDNPYQRKGEIEVYGSKADIAKLFPYSNTAFDNFIDNFGEFIQRVQEWRGSEEGTVFFTLHDLERRIMQLLREFGEIEVVKLGNESVEVHVRSIADIYSHAQALGYRDEEIEQLLDLLERRELIDKQHYKIRERPSRSIDLDTVTAQVNEFGHTIEVLLEGFHEDNQLLRLLGDAEKWLEFLREQRSSGAPDAQKIHRLQRTIQTRQQDLTDIIRREETNLKREVHLIRQSIKPVNPRHIEVLNTPIGGSVGFVEQINVLRTNLVRQANKVRSEAGQVATQFGRIESAVQNEELTPERLIRLVHEIAAIREEIQQVSTSVSEFEQQYSDMSRWREVVELGSQLSDQMQQMVNVTGSQQNQFKDISLRIREEISSANSSNKLAVLPSHTIYHSQLANLLESVRKIRHDAEAEFIELQNRYHHALTQERLYPREKIGKPYSYNISDPDASYDLLYKRVQDIVSEIHQQLLERLTEPRRDIANLRNSPVLSEAGEQDRESIIEHCDKFLNAVDSELESLKSLELEIQDITVIRDFAARNPERFQNIVNHLISSKSMYSDLKEEQNKITRWLDTISLTPDEEHVLQTLDGTITETDMGVWRENSDVSDDTFWAAMRALYEKHRIRINISRIRR